VRKKAPIGTHSAWEFSIGEKAASMLATTRKHSKEPPLTHLASVGRGFVLGFPHPYARCRGSGPAEGGTEDRQG